MENRSIAGKTIPLVLAGNAIGSLTSSDNTRGVARRHHKMCRFLTGKGSLLETLYMVLVRLYTPSQGNFNRDEVSFADHKYFVLQKAKNDIRRLARRGGIRRISTMFYPDARHALKAYLGRVLEDCCRIAEYRNRKTVTVTDVIFALKRQGIPIHGFDPAFVKRGGGM